MSDRKMVQFQQLFTSRLTALNHIMDVSAAHFNEQMFDFESRLIDDMLPLSTQIAFTCNQPHNFIQWCEGEETDVLKPTIESIEHATQLIEHTIFRLSKLHLDDSKLTEVKKIELGGGRYLELPGVEYVEAFLIPNLYFHLVTTYDILRMRGVPLGKHNYMHHLVHQVKQA